MLNKNTEKMKMRFNNLKKNFKKIKKKYSLKTLN
jgi:hypothetical protein